MFTPIATIAAAALVSAPSGPAGWACTNDGIAQIQCVGANCSVEVADFTPMQVYVEADSLEVCAYSACFSGPLSLRSVGRHWLLSGEVVHPGGDESPEALSMILDPADRVALLRWQGFAHPMRCAERQSAQGTAPGSGE